MEDGGSIVIKVELTKAKKSMSVEKRFITLQAKKLEECLRPDKRVSRTLLRMKAKELGATMERLDHTAREALALDLSEEDAGWVHNYVETERDRVQSALAAVQDTVEAREDEASTSFHSGDTEIRQFKESEAANPLQTGHQMGDRVKKNLEVDSGGNERINLDSNTINLRSRMTDFEDFIPSGGGRKSSVNWMVNPQINVESSNQRGGNIRSSIEVKMPKFSGNMLEFQEWSNMFEALIHSTNRSSAEKMGLLKASMNEKCRRLIGGFGNTEAHYHAALRTLNKVFGDSELLVEAHQRELENLPRIKPREPNSLADFAFTVQGHVLVIQDRVPRSDVIWGQLERSLERKLDHDLFRSWESHAREIPRGSRIDEFCNWLLSIVHSDQRYHGQSLLGERASLGSNERTRNHNTSTQPIRKCPKCLADHRLSDCDEFRGLDGNGRMRFAQDNKICFGCLNQGHMSRQCRSKRSCPKCGRSHHPSLHEGDSKPNSASTNTISRSQNVILGVIAIRCSGPSGDIIVNGLVDEGSDSSFISEKIFKRLGLDHSCPGTLLVHGTTGMTRLRSYEGTVQVGQVGGGEKYNLEVRSLPVVCKGLRGIKWASIQGQWNHLQDLPLSGNCNQVDILLGLDGGELIEPLETRRGGCDEPHAFRTLLGWVCRGPIPGNTSVEIQSHSSSIQDVNLVLDQQLNEFFATEAYGAEGSEPSTKPMSLQDEYALKMINETTTRRSDGPGYQVALPWIPGVPKPQNNRRLAEKRFESLERRFQRDQDFAGAYSKSIQKTLSEGYATKVEDQNELEHPNQAYLPHHGVWKKNGKDVRVVFDSAARFQGTSLNDCLLSGPALQNDLMDVLLRFREREIAVVGDIEAMFSRVVMDPDDARYHRFLWRFHQTEEIATYQMLGVVFGDTPSPCLAIRTLMRTSEDFPCGPGVKVAIRDQFYVDDYLNSHGSEREALEMARDVRDVLARGNFNLRGWETNSPAVTSDLEGGMHGGQRSLTDGDQCTRVLGLHWRTTWDDLSFFATSHELVRTRRGLLSRLAGLYDPLGLIAPITVAGKIMMKHLVIRGLDWDDPVDQKSMEWWIQWNSGLNLLSATCFPRCMAPMSGRDITQELHVFCDASEDAFCAVAYLRCSNQENDVSVRLVASKTRVAPKKPLTIPKLELQAAVLAARLADYLGRVLRIKLDGRFFWTDSRVVHCWIRSVAQTYKPFVALRIGEIQGLTLEREWRHVPGKLNPADLGTRVSASVRITDLWIDGPPFLSNPIGTWPPELDTSETNEEQRQKYRVEPVEIHVARVGEEATSLEHLLQPIIPEAQPTSLEDLISKAQSESFSEDFTEAGVFQLARKSRLSNLSPFVDDVGLLRARGRLSQAQVGYDQRFPVILCPRHPLTKLILKKEHKTDHHPSVNQGLALIRQKYWVLRGREAVRKVRMECKFCQKMMATPASQEMADLPAERLAMGKPTFWNTSVDLFGPFEVLVLRNKVEKRWGVLFACMTTRAVHLEIVPSLSTQDFLNTLRNFVNLRGKPDLLYCDNGTNFVGARNFLRELQESSARIESSSVASDIRWQFQVPGAPHWGGIHESLVKAAKKALVKVLEEDQEAKRHLRDHELWTVMCEVTGMLNSRPLTYESSDEGDSRALSPNHFLLMRGNATAPPGNYVSMDPKKHFGYVQGIVDRIWVRWTMEYLPSLLTRNKWRIKQANIPLGCEVLIVGTPEPRSRWKFGKVVEVHPGVDDLVRAVTIQTEDGLIRRPITKICPLQKPTGGAKVTPTPPNNTGGGMDERFRAP
ncbi:uncharacterized protein LOC131880688 [Tigriopus californicus]|uniref:uncharacterized protein LOC131880688 n=1 Tax=Tigriopus californicus TaxID=6832 RepID=UPI0027DA0486|nr:uncharacterized protein LOC131880688 [Tigriopus californicus]